MLLQNLVTIQSVPRSGSSWLGQIFRSSPQVAFRFQPLFSYAFKGRIGSDSSRVEILRFFNDIRDSEDDFIHQRDRAVHVEYPEFTESMNASHTVMKEVRYNNVVRNMVEQVPELKLIGLVRHPCAVLDSWFNAPREFKPEWSFEEEWRSGSKKNMGRPEEAFGFDKWKEVAQLFLDLEREKPDRVKVVRYARLNSDPMKVVADLFDFCELDFGQRTIDFIRQSRSKEGTDANSVYRLERADIAWKKRLPEHIIATVHEELSDGPLSAFLEV
ncbi:MAG: sulfotransferase domain-containing protein [Candidatus Omnitrophica bacterium]|nr:sulfotransferase domain-containing protein [Candidatus Omnitrophota bacterium]